MAEEIVLVVDDDRTTVRLCQRLLERASYRVITAMDPLEALDHIRQQHIDLLLSDIRMPVMDGFELIRQAKDAQPDLPVLVMTGYGSIDNAIQALHRGVEGLILKPFTNTAELIQSVQRVIGESQQKKDAARLQALRPLFDVTERLLAETSPQTLEKLVLNSIQDLFGASWAGIHRLNGQNNCLTAIQIVDNSSQPNNTFNMEDLIQTLIADGSTLVCTCASCANQEAQQKIREKNIATLMIAQVQRDNQFVFCSARETGQPCFTQADLEMFVIFARQAAVALENAKLYSELKEYIRRVEESQRALVQAEKMAAVGRLVASMAHEINNPLQAVRNCLHLANRKGVASDQRFRYLEMMDIELDRLVQTVKQMLDFYRPGSPDREIVEITQIISQVLDLLKPQLHEQKIHVHYHPDLQSGQVFVVPGQIQQVILNLLINAMDAIDESCKESQDRELKREIWINTYFADQKLYLLVEDSGQGIADDLNEQVFEPFVSTKHNGTGLGLAVSYGIMERHQGSLTLVSPRYGQGACFEITLPLDAERKNGKDFNC
ncbi:MAG: response regulator [Anaerolineaceae bacterium]|nr:response regulator [Anaerolineaceae bacterium]